MKLHKTIRDIKREHPDWEVTTTSKNHLRWKHKGGAIVVSSSCISTVDYRSMRNLKAALKREEEKCSA